MWIKNMQKDELVKELGRFQEISSLVLPRTARFPRLPHIDYHVGIEPHRGCVCGDHLALLNFSEYNLAEQMQQARESGNDLLARTLAKNADRFGILIADSSGHMIADHLNINYLHASFKTGVAYELKYKGEITADLFEMLNSTFYARNQVDYLRDPPFITLIYGEIADDGRFRFLSAGHPPPFIFSREFGTLVQLSPNQTQSSTPLGLLPSKYRADVEHFEPYGKTKDTYPINELQILGWGDVLILYTDGFIEQQNGTMNYCKTRLEHVLRDVKDGTAKEIHTAIRNDLKSITTLDDDLTLAVIKKT